MSRVVKRTIKWGLLAIFAYVAIGWIVKDIYFSICEWQPDETFVEVWRREIKVYTIVAAIISGIFALNCCLSDTSLSFGRTYTRSDIYWGIPMGIFFAVFYGKDYIPMSTGAGLLVNILNIIAMITPIYGLFVIENENDNKKRMIGNNFQKTLLLLAMFMPMALFAQQTLMPVSATITDAQGTYTSEHFDCPNMTVWDKGNSVMISWAGDEIPLNQSAYNKDTYKQSATVDNRSVNIVAHRNSSSRKIFMVTVKIRMPQGSVSITFKERRFL